MAAGEMGTGSVFGGALTVELLAPFLIIYRNQMNCFGWKLYHIREICADKLGKITKEIFAT
jgi:hypothetical protein